MIILHIAHIDNNEANGVSVVVPKYIEEQSRYEKVALLNISKYIIMEKNKNVKIFNIKNCTSINFLEEPFNKPDIVVFHEVYRYQYIKLYKELINYNIPYIIIPHGCLDKQAQKRKKIKKIIGNAFLFRRFINNAKKVQFLSRGEKKSSLEYYKDSYILGNGISIDKSIKKQKNNKDIFKYIYIGRFDISHKGIDILLEACKHNKEFMKENNIKLEIYGKNDGRKNGREYISKYIKDNNLNDIVILNSDIYGKEKIEKLLDADIFIQTSRHEGQPLSILEALGYGKPVIVTPGTNFAEIVEKEKMGWKVSFDSNDIAKKMREAYRFCMEKGEIEYSNNARKYIEDKFTWDYITKEALKIYKNIKKGESK